MKPILLTLAAALGVALIVPGSSTASANLMTPADPPFQAQPRTITNCGVCEHKTWDHGKHCIGCTSGCNCEVGGFTSGGWDYLGKWYPGVPGYTGTPPAGWPCAYQPVTPNDCPS